MYTCGWAYKLNLKILTPGRVSNVAKVKPLHDISKSRTYFLGGWHWGFTQYRVKEPFITSGHVVGYVPVSLCLCGSLENWKPSQFPGQLEREWLSLLGVAWQPATQLPRVSFQGSASSQKAHSLLVRASTDTKGIVVDVRVQIGQRGSCI